MFRCCCVRKSPDVLLKDTRNVKPIRFTKKQLLKFYFDNPKDVGIQQLKRIKTCPSGEFILNLWKEELVQKNTDDQKVYKTIIQILEDPTNCTVDQDVEESPLFQTKICTQLIKHSSFLKHKSIEVFVSLLTIETAQEVCRGLNESGIKHIEGYFSLSQKQACEHICEEKKQQNKKHVSHMVNCAHCSKRN